jgi:hypothetical protein
MALQLPSPLRADAPTSPLTIREGGIDVAALQLPESAHNSGYRNPDDYDAVGSFDFVLDVIARYKIQDVTVDLVRGTKNMFVFVQLQIDDDDSLQIFEEDFPAGYFFNGVEDHFKVSPTFHDLPQKIEGPVYSNVLGFCMPTGPFRVSPMTMLTHDLTITVRDPGSDQQVLAFAAVPKPSFPFLLKMRDDGAIVYFQDTYGVCKFDLRLPDGTGTYIFRDTNATKESPLRAFQMIFSTPAAIPPPESISLNNTDRAFGVFLEPPLKWNNVLNVSLWKRVVTVCAETFTERTKINIVPFMTGVHLGNGENRFKLTTKRIDGVDTNIFSADLRYMTDDENPDASYISGMESMLAFLKEVPLATYVLPKLEDSAVGAGASSSSSSSSKRATSSNDSDDDEGLHGHQGHQGPKKKRKGAFYDETSFKAWFISKFHSFGAVGGRGGCKRGESYEAKKNEMREEKIEDLRLSATRFMTDDEYDDFVAETKKTFGI